MKKEESEHEFLERVLGIRPEPMTEMEKFFEERTPESAEMAENNPEREDNSAIETSSTDTHE